jgi:hypothetical protein
MEEISSVGVNVVCSAMFRLAQSSVFAQCCLVPVLRSALFHKPSKSMHRTATRWSDITTKILIYEFCTPLLPSKVIKEKRDLCTVSFQFTLNHNRVSCPIDSPTTSVANEKRHQFTPISSYKKAPPWVSALFLNKGYFCLILCFATTSVQLLNSSQYGFSYSDHVATLAHPHHICLIPPASPNIIRANDSNSLRI